MNSKTMVKGCIVMWLPYTAGFIVALAPHGWVGGILSGVAGACLFLFGGPLCRWATKDKANQWQSGNL